MKEQKLFERSNVYVEVGDRGCWVGVSDSLTGADQEMALTEQEILLLYMALGDALKGKI